MISAKIYTPRIENIKIKSKSKLPMLAIAGKLAIKVWKMSFRDLFLLKSLNTLPILKDLIIVVFGPIRTLVVRDKEILMRVNNTIIISKLFHPSLKYLAPKAITLMTTSSVNIAANT